MRDNPGTKCKIAVRGSFLFKIILILCLLAVILFLAVLIVPSYMEQKELAKRVHAIVDMRDSAVGLEAYYGDHKAYPGMCPLREFGTDGNGLVKAGGAGLTAIDPGGRGRQGLTTPVAYLDSLTTDRLSPNQLFPFAYFTDGKGWILFSPGLDGHYDINPAVDYMSSSTKTRNHLLTYGTYDPTNGIISGGDIWRVSTQ